MHPHAPTRHKSRCRRHAAVPAPAHNGTYRMASTAPAPPRPCNALLHGLPCNHLLPHFQVNGSSYFAAPPGEPTAVQLLAAAEPPAQRPRPTPRPGAHPAAPGLQVGLHRSGASPALCCGQGLRKIRGTARMYSASVCSTADISEGGAALGKGSVRGTARPMDRALGPKPGPVRLVAGCLP